MFFVSLTISKQWDNYETNVYLHVRCNELRRSGEILTRNEKMSSESLSCSQCKKMIRYTTSSTVKRAFLASKVAKGGCLKKLLVDLINRRVC